ncbi:MAG: energy-coupling factor transporter ATPase [Ruminococcaceae bacterium]|nr:energy-coupling factor transporter ATPase [Oscillospiraceae bacterium]
MSKIVKAENICFAYEGETPEEKVEALKDVSFEIEEGSFVAILGRNGSGKSTLAKLLCMINAPDSGKLTVDGVEVTSEGASEEDIYRARRNVGMVFQNPDNQIVATIVEEDVAFGPENLGLPSEKIRHRVDEALETVGMTKYARHSAARLSGGQKQRIAIAGVIAMRRKCIIFDESTAMLDPLGRHEVMENIVKLNREEGITVIMITHYMNEASLADRVIVMEDGGIIMDGSPEEVFVRAEELWKAGLDVPQTTELMWRLRAEGLDVPLDAFEPEECAAAVRAALEKRGCL